MGETVKCQKAGKSGLRFLGWLLGIGFFLVSFACTGPLELHQRSSAMRPQIQSSRIEVVSLDNKMAELRIHLRIDNPGESLVGKTATIEWLLDEHLFALSRHSLDFENPAHQIGEQTIAVSLSYLSIPFLEFSAARRAENFQLIARGELLAEVEGRQITLPFSGQTLLTRPKDR